MRYENADHVDYSGLLGRRFAIGLPLAITGALLIPLAICGRMYVDVLPVFVLTFLLWLLAWYVAVGVLFRLPLSVAIVVQLMVMSCLQLGWL